MFHLVFFKVLKSNKMKKNIIIISLFLAIGLFFSSCEPTVDSGIGLDQPPTDAQINMAKVAGADANHWVFTNTSTVTGIAYWDFGNGVTATGNQVTAFYPDVDTYTITLTLVTNGGFIKKTMTHTQTTPDPVAGNLVKGGKFATADDISKWTVDKLGGSCTLADGWAKFTNGDGSWGQAALQQPITVVAGQKYKIDLKFKTPGVNQGWFKVYACTTKPTAGSEYKGDILVAEVNIWSVSSAISGQFSAILNPDSGTKTSNIVTFTTSGTIYLSIQCGANSLQGGVSITNVEFRGYNP